MGDRIFDAIMKIVDAGFIVAMFVIAWVFCLVVSFVILAITGLPIWLSLVGATLGAIALTWFFNKLAGGVVNGIFASFGNESTRREILEKHGVESREELLAGRSNPGLARHVRELAELRDDGIISDEEFLRRKNDILDNA